MFKMNRIAVILSAFVAALLSPQAIAQVKPAVVRSVDEPARVPYLVSAAPTCPFQNECYVAGSAVPAGKRLRVTEVEGVVVFAQSGNWFAALHLNDTNHPLVIFPTTPFNAAFWGSTVSFHEHVDFFFEAGQTPVLEVGTLPNGVSTDPRTRLTIVGYMVDVAP
jgi:hypothetical protein